MLRDAEPATVRPRARAAFRVGAGVARLARLARSRRGRRGAPAADLRRRGPRRSSIWRRARRRSSGGGSTKRSEGVAAVVDAVHDDADDADGAVRGRSPARSCRRFAATRCARASSVRWFAEATALAILGSGGGDDGSGCDSDDTDDDAGPLISSKTPHAPRAPPEDPTPAPLMALRAAALELALWQYVAAERSLRLALQRAKADVGPDDGDGDDAPGFGRRRRRRAPAAVRAPPDDDGAVSRDAAGFENSYDVDGRALAQLTALLGAREPARRPRRRGSATAGRAAFCAAAAWLPGARGAPRATQRATCDCVARLLAVALDCVWPPPADDGAHDAGDDGDAGARRGRHGGRTSPRR
ncbi:hypothetical protein JL721_4341 [Aureococcus anophagefferens]|nr:hypothetical protein JL721_4341 [Aureococcus anophagefferens]